MVILIEAKTPHATFKQVFSDAEEALEKVEMLEAAGWSVSFLVFNDISKDEYCTKMADQAMDRLEEYYPSNQTAH